MLADPAKCEEALAAGADMAGLDDYVEKIKNGWTDVDVIICTPAVMAKVGALGRVLGPRGLDAEPQDRYRYHGRGQGRERGEGR